MNKHRLLEKLISVRKGIRTESCGICNSIRSIPGAVKWVENMAPKWYKFSGDAEYPIPHPTMTADAAYVYCRSIMWDDETEYGRNRLEFLDFLIEEATKLEGTFYES